MYLPDFLEGFDRLVAFDAETTGKRAPDAEFIRKLRIPRQSGQGLNEPAPSEQQEDRCGETSRLRGCDGHIHPSQDRRPRWLRRALFASA
jgi:hypothetical protein